MLHMRLRVVYPREELAGQVVKALRDEFECLGDIEERKTLAEKARQLCNKWRRETGFQPADAKWLTGREQLRYYDYPVIYR